MLGAVDPEIRVGEGDLQELAIVGDAAGADVGREEATRRAHSGDREDVGALKVGYPADEDG